MAETINILWFENETGVVDQIQANIKSIYQAKDVQIVIETDEGDSPVDVDKLEKKDIVVIDYKLNGRRTGTQILASIRENSCVADVLLYSEAPENLVGIDEKIGHYGHVRQVIKRSNIQDVLCNMIDLSRNKFGDIIMVRGLILSEFVNLESELNSFLAAYYVADKVKSEEFKLQVLENRNLSFCVKSDAFSRIKIKEESSSSKLGKLLEKVTKTSLENISETRNKIAHCKYAQGQLSGGTQPPYAISREKMLALRLKIKRTSLILGLSCRTLNL